VRRRARDRDLEAIGSLVPKVLGDLGLGSAARVMRVAERWEEAVGPEIARHCRPTALRGSVLEVTVDSSVWCHQLRLRASEIVAALRRVLGEEAPSEVWLRVG
jgi:predicted nucleic acid-binding Zn ribbon protein